MKAEYRGWLSDDKGDDARVQWSVNTDGDIKTYDFEVMDRQQILDFYADTYFTGSVDTLVERLENLRDQINAFVDAVEEAEQENT